MSRLVRSFLLALFVPLLTTCVPVRPAMPRSNPPEVVVRLWVAPDATVPRKAIVDGCRHWQMFGVRCVEVSEAKQANVRVLFSHEKCMTRTQHAAKANQQNVPAPAPRLPIRPECRDRPPSVEDDLPVLALAHADGSIVIHLACLQDAWPEDRFSNGRFAPTHLLSTAAHEIGHTLGLDHVPLTCGDVCVEYPTLPDGTKVCGPSIMNPEVDALVSPPTVTDGWAFDLRDAKLP